MPNPSLVRAVMHAQTGWPSKEIVNDWRSVFLDMKNLHAEMCIPIVAIIVPLCVFHPSFFLKTKLQAE